MVKMSSGWRRSATSNTASEAAFAAPYRKLECLDGISLQLTGRQADIMGK